MMFGTIVISGLQMISNCGYSQRNITIAALSLSIGIGFTQFLKSLAFSLRLSKMYLQKTVLL